MYSINAISKVRFSSARPQRIRLHKSAASTVELICMEPGQEIPAVGEGTSYYVLSGKAGVDEAGEKAEFATGNFFAADGGQESVILAAGEQRLIMLSFTTG